MMILLDDNEEGQNEEVDSDAVSVPEFSPYKEHQPPEIPHQASVHRSGIPRKRSTISIL